MRSGIRKERKRIKDRKRETRKKIERNQT